MKATHVDYKFTIMPYGIPKIMKILGCGYLVNEKDEALLFLEELDYPRCVTGGIKLIGEYHPDCGVYYQLYVDLGNMHLRSVYTNTENAEKLLSKLHVNPWSIREHRGSTGKIVFVGFNSANQ